MLPLHLQGWNSMWPGSEPQRQMRHVSSPSPVSLPELWLLRRLLLLLLLLPAGKPSELDCACSAPAPAPESSSIASAPGSKSGLSATAVVYTCTAERLPAGQPPCCLHHPQDGSASALPASRTSRTALPALLRRTCRMPELSRAAVEQLLTRPFASGCVFSEKGAVRFCPRPQSALGSATAGEAHAQCWEVTCRGFRSRCANIARSRPWRNARCRMLTVLGLGVILCSIRAAVVVPLVAAGWQQQGFKAAAGLRMISWPPLAYCTGGGTSPPAVYDIRASP